MTMKTLLFAALLFTLASTAHAVEMPKELRGIWCAKELTAQKEIYARCHKADGEDTLGVDARKFFPAEETVCAPLAIMSNNGGYFVQAHCRGQHESDWNGRAPKRWRLFNGGRQLEITAVNEAEQDNVICETMTAHIWQNIPTKRSRTFAFPCRSKKRIFQLIS
jgi:hypothetical protein